MVEFFLLAFPRFPLRKKEHKSYFGKNRTHHFRTSRCAGYLLDHSGVGSYYLDIVDLTVVSLQPDLLLVFNLTLSGPDMCLDGYLRPTVFPLQY